MDTTKGDNWHTIVIFLEISKIVPFLRQYFETLGEENLPHYTIRGEGRSESLHNEGRSESLITSYYIVSLRYYKTDLILDQTIQRLIDKIGATYEWQPLIDSIYFKYHAWIMPGQEDPKRDIINCTLLSKLSRLTFLILDNYRDVPDAKIELTHLFCNMLGLKETIYTKYIKSLKRPIIGPGYKDGLITHDEGIYYNYPCEYEKTALQFVYHTLYDIETLYEILQPSSDSPKPKKKASKKKKANK